VKGRYTEGLKKIILKLIWNSNGREPKLGMTEE
jgi:hypothetical protein